MAHRYSFSLSSITQGMHGMQSCSNEAQAENLGIFRHQKHTCMPFWAGEQITEGGSWVNKVPKGEEKLFSIFLGNASPTAHSLGNYTGIQAE